MKLRIPKIMSAQTARQVMTIIGARAILVRALMPSLRALTLALLLLISVVSAFSLSHSPNRNDSTSATVTVSLITCYPGSEIYELCGHEAIRIRGEGIDSVWNYGIFDFNEPNFIYRFVKGKTDYYVGGYPFAWFMPEYMARGSKVVEQDLNLTSREAQSLHHMLQRRSLPANCRYRYNYLTDNCATRIIDDIDSSLGQNISYAGSTRFATYRQALRQYHSNYPWYQFGIDLVLGSGLDASINGRQEMFLPVEMSRHTAKASMPDGRPMVKATRVLYNGRDDAVLPPTPWYLTPMAAALALMFISIIITVADAYRRKISAWWYTLYFTLIGLSGTLISFLVFFSDHAATSPNLLIFWLNPLQLLISVFIWVKKAKKFVRLLMWLNICIVVLLLVAWPLQQQCADPAIFPILAADLVLAGAYTLFTSADGTPPVEARGNKKTSTRRKQRANRLK